MPKENEGVVNTFFLFTYWCFVVSCYETRDDIVFVGKLNDTVLYPIFFAYTYMSEDIRVKTKCVIQFSV
jgi:hypothetical protein